MIFILLISACALAMSAILYFSHRHRVHQEVIRAITGLHRITQLKSLLLNIQKHRGLTTGYLNGDHSLTEAIRTIQTRVDKQWQDIAQEEPAITHDSRFEGVSTHWSRLRDRWKDLTVANNIEQHSRLVLNLLYLIENRAENEPLLYKHGLDTGLDMIWKELLETIEAIGQARAIGTGVVAARQSSAVERIQLKFLTEKIETKLTGLKEVLEKQGSQSASEAPPPYNRQWMHSFLSRSDETVDKLMAMMHHHVLSDALIEIRAEDFFALATQSIEPLEELFDQATKELKKRCEEF